MSKNKLNFNTNLSSLKELVKYIYGDLVILGMKNTGKTNLLKLLARHLMKESKNHVIIFETFPYWIHTFDKIPYMIIDDESVYKPDKEERKLMHRTKDYIIANEDEIVKFLRTNKDVIFLIECEDMDRISAVMSFIIYTIYRLQYKRAKKNILNKVGENYWFLVEEAHNLLDSTVISKKTFNRLRKMHNEFRNLLMHIVCVTLRLQDLNPKIRAKMNILTGKVSLDDYQLKIRNLMRHSKYRRLITELPIGVFIYPETDMVIKTELFNSKGKPYKVETLK